MLNSIILDSVKDSDEIYPDRLPFIGFTPISDSNKLDATPPTEIKDKAAVPKADKVRYFSDNTLI